MILSDEDKKINSVPYEVRNWKMVYGNAKAMLERFGVGDIIVLRDINGKLVTRGHFIHKLIITNIDSDGLTWARTILVSGKLSKHTVCIPMYHDHENIELDPEYIESQLLDSKYQYDETNKKIAVERKRIRAINVNKIIQMDTKESINKFLLDCSVDPKKEIWASVSLSPKSNAIYKMNIAKVSSDDFVILETSNYEELPNSYTYEFNITWQDWEYLRNGRVRGELFFFSSKPETLGY